MDTITTITTITTSTTTTGPDPTTEREPFAAALAALRGAGIEFEVVESSHLDRAA